MGQSLNILTASYSLVSQSVQSHPTNMKNPLSDSTSLSTPGLLLGKTASREESSSEMLTEKKLSESKVDSGTFTMRSAERKSLIEEGRWLSLDRRGKTSRQNTA